MPLEPGVLNPGVNHDTLDRTTAGAALWVHLLWVRVRCTKADRPRPPRTEPLQLTPSSGGQAMLWLHGPDNKKVQATDGLVIGRQANLLGLAPKEKPSMISRRHVRISVQVGRTAIHRRHRPCTPAQPQHTHARTHGPCVDLPAAANPTSWPVLRRRTRAAACRRQL